METNIELFVTIIKAGLFFWAGFTAGILSTITAWVLIKILPNIDGYLSLVKSYTRYVRDTKIGGKKNGK